jgi:hypothetical protein
MTETQHAQMMEAFAALGRSMAKAVRSLNAYGAAKRESEVREARTRRLRTR